MEKSKKKQTNKIVNLLKKETKLTHILYITYNYYIHTYTYYIQSKHIEKTFVCT